MHIDNLVNTGRTKSPKFMFKYLKLVQKINGI